MIPIRRLAALLPLLCLAFIPKRAEALELDGGLRAVIWNDDYKLGWGGEVGAIRKANEKWELGLHLNYTHFTSKVPESVNDADELGGYIAAYFTPSIDQGFTIRIGPHVGYANLESHYLDLGADAQAVFKVANLWSFYTAFIPSFLIGSDDQALFRIGLGLQYHVGN
jgi:hypothetical protein